MRVLFPCFSSHNSAASSPGRSQNPDTVHLPITCISNYTSLASLTEITHSPLTLWWQKETVVGRPSLVTSLEERGYFLVQWHTYTQARMGPGPGEFPSALVNHVRSNYLNHNSIQLYIELE